MSGMAVILISFLLGSAGGIAVAGWWLNGYQDQINERLRALENEVADDTREHWIEGVQRGEKDWDWPAGGH